MATLNLITSNPVTDAYNASQKRMADQEAADLQNAIARQSYTFNAEEHPLRLRGITANTETLERTNQFGKDTYQNDITKSNNDTTKSGVDLGQAQENLKFSQDTHPYQVRGYAADASNKESQDRVQVGTENDQIAGVKLGNEGKRLSNLQLVTSIDQGNASWGQQQLAGQTENEENALLAVALDPVNGAKRAEAAGIEVPQEYIETIRANPYIAHAVADYVTQLRSIPGADAAFRYNEFTQNIAQILQKSPGEIPSAVSAAIASAKQRAPQKEIDPVWKSATEQAGKELDQQFFASPDERAGAIDKRAREIYRSLKSGPDATAPAPTAPSAGTDQPAPAPAPRQWWQLGSDDASASAGPQPMPRLPDGKLDRSKLVKGGIYNMEGVGRVRFNGQAFEAVGQ